MHSNPPKGLGDSRESIRARASIAPIRAYPSISVVYIATDSGAATHSRRYPRVAIPPPFFFFVEITAKTSRKRISIDGTNIAGHLTSDRASSDLQFMAVCTVIVRIRVAHAVFRRTRLLSIPSMWEFDSPFHQQLCCTLLLLPSLANLIARDATTTEYPEKVIRSYAISPMNKGGTYSATSERDSAFVTRLLCRFSEVTRIFLMRPRYHPGDHFARRNGKGEYR